MSDGFSYRADLATTGLPEVLAVVERCPLPGVLTVTRSGMVKHVFSRDGHVVYATSSDPVDRLAEYVRRAGLVGEELIDSLDQARSNSSRRLGVLLVERGLLSPREVYEAICRQVEAIVWSLFEWRTGTAEFEPGEAGEDVVQVKLPVRRVVFEGLKRAPAPGHDGDASRVVEPSFSYEELIDIGVGADEMALLRAVDGHRTLAELAASSSMDAAEALRRLRAFEVLSLVRARPATRRTVVDAPAASSDGPAPIERSS